MATWADRRDAYNAEQRAIRRQEQERNALADILRGAYQAPQAGQTAIIPATAVDDEGNPMPSQQAIPARPGGFDMQNAIGALIRGGRGDMALNLATMMEKSKQMGGMPADVLSTQWLLNQPEDVRKLHFENKRSPSVMNLGGTMAVRDPRGGISESYAVTPKISETPVFKGAQASAEASAKADVARVEAETKKATQANTVLGYLDEADNLLDKSSSGPAGTAYAAGKGVLGVSDETTQANQQLKLISGWLVANVPRMEGPQSNFDVQNYKTMAADLGNTNIPIGDRKATLTQLRKLQEKYTSLNAGKEPMADKPEGSAKPQRKAPAGAKEGTMNGRRVFSTDGGKTAFYTDTGERAK